MYTRRNIYTMIDPKDNTYDYEDPGRTTYDIDTAYEWIKAGCEQVAILDALSLAYIGYMDIEDLYRYEELDDAG